MAACAVILNTQAVPCFSLCASGLGWNEEGAWPCGHLALEVECSATREAPIEDFESVPPTPMSLTPAELDALVLGAQASGP